VDNNERYLNVFKEVFDLEGNQISDSFSYESVPQWDSIGHMSLIASLENEFNIMLEMDDVIDFSDFGKGKEILKKYKVDFAN
jgi:acyl carrier protein